MPTRKITFTLFILININCYSQFLLPDDVLKNNIKSVIQNSWNEGLLLSTVEYFYNKDGRLEEDSYHHFNYQNGTGNYSKKKYVYYNNDLVKTYHYFDHILIDSTTHHVNWTGTDWIFTDTIYLISTGKITVRQSSKTQDSVHVLFKKCTYYNDTLQDKEFTSIYPLNDSVKIKIQKSDIYYQGKKRNYENDSTVEISTPSLFKSMTWENGKFKSSLVRNFIDSVLFYEVTEEFDFKGKHKIKRETWYDEGGNRIKFKTNNKGNKTLYYQYETHRWKGMKTEETITYEGKRKIKEKCRSQLDQRNLPQHVLYYDKRDNITGKITWEYTYW